LIGWLAGQPVFDAGRTPRLTGGGATVGLDAAVTGGLAAGAMVGGVGAAVGAAVAVGGIAVAGGGDGLAGGAVL